MAKQQRENTHIMLIWQARQPRSLIWKCSSLTWVIMEHQLLVSLSGGRERRTRGRRVKDGKRDAKEERIQTSMKTWTRVRILLSLFTCLHVPPNPIMSLRWYKYCFPYLSAGAGVSQVSLFLQTFSAVQYRSWHEMWALVYTASIAKTTQTVPLFSIRGGYSSVPSINSTTLTVLLPSSSSTKSHRKYNTIFNFHLPQVGLSFKTKFLSAGL